MYQATQKISSRIQQLCRLTVVSLFFISISFLSNCDTTSADKPKDLIEEATYIDLLVEFQLLKSISVIQSSTDTDSLEQVIFNSYKIDEDRFLRSHFYYQSQTEAQIKRIEQAIDRVKEEQGRGNKPKTEDDFN